MNKVALKFDDHYIIQSQGKLLINCMNIKKIIRILNIIIRLSTPVISLRFAVNATFISSLLIMKSLQTYTNDNVIEIHRGRKCSRLITR